MDRLSRLTAYRTLLKYPVLKDINDLRAPSPAPVPRQSHPQQYATGTAHSGLRARPPSPPGCKRDTRHADRQVANEPAGSAGTTPRGTGTTAPAAPSQPRSGLGRGGAGARP